MKGSLGVIARPNLPLPDGKLTSKLVIVILFQLLVQSPIQMVFPDRQHVPEGFVTIFTVEILAHGAPNTE